MLGGIFYFYINFNRTANSGRPDQTPRSAASDLGLHCLLMSNKKDARLIKDYLTFMLLIFENCYIIVHSRLQEKRRVEMQHLVDVSGRFL